MGPYGLFRDSKSKPDAATAAVSGFTYAIERAEKIFELVLGYTAAVVANSDTSHSVNP